MLRLTKTLELTLRSRETRFSYDFWKALTMAVGFHAAFFLIFRIASLPNCDHIQPLIPIPVEIELDTPATTALLPSAEIVLFPLDTPEPLHYQLTEPLSAPYYSKTLPLQEPDFSELEHLPYVPLEDL